MKARRDTYSVTVSVSDGMDINGDPDPSTDATIPVTINVTNVDEAPVIDGDLKLSTSKRTPRVLSQPTRLKIPRDTHIAGTFQALTRVPSTSQVAT